MILARVGCVMSAMSLQLAGVSFYVPLGASQSARADLVSASATANGS